MSALHPDFLRLPIAHRGYHDKRDGRPENTIAAIEAAVAAGYGVEFDLQPSSDGVPMVFHDYDLMRMADEQGYLADISAEELGKTILTGHDKGIPTLAEVLEIVAGRVPLLIEIKDQDGKMGPNVGPFEQTVAEVLGGYEGPFAVMSFNPYSVAAMHKAMPDATVGLVTCDFPADDWPMLDADAREHLARIGDFDRVGASFISHHHKDLHNPRVTALKADGVPILCWTIRSPEAEAEARKVADNITFEGYAAAMPGPAA
ncbi:glycerophosphodiester phosphodiesterase family protein [Paracoccus pacificus]|uniref:Glycerophosphodiester phosphodiesterase family protein n=1 Tax=Paracoccus pacificus TaxID=1463598 RepID=A0ABW4R1N9_9RHOB